METRRESKASVDLDSQDDDEKSGNSLTTKRESHPDKNESEEKNCYCCNIMFGLLVIFIFFALLGFIIDFVQSRQNRIQRDIKENETSTSQGNGCSANSFLIKDTVYDEITNTAPCLYDGGDCCREDKDTTLCQVCTCIVPVQKYELIKLLKANRVAVYTGPKKNEFFELKTVDDVASKAGCQKLCLDFSLENEQMDSWIYEADRNNTCTCLTFKACYDECNQNEIMSLHNYNNLILLNSVDYFALMTRILPCDRRCFSDGTGYTDPIVTTKTKWAPTAEHCQAMCRNDSDCTHFTWTTNNFTDSIFPSLFFDMCSFYKRAFGDELIEAPGKISGPADCHLDWPITETEEDPKADGFCDDDINNEENKFDGGDCCVIKIDCSFCSQCECHTTINHGMSSSGCQDFMQPKPCTSNRSKMMISLGFLPILGEMDHNGSRIEILDLENSNVACSFYGDGLTIKSLYQEPGTAVGGLISGYPVICGTAEEGECYHPDCINNVCWRLDPSGAWHNFFQSLSRLSAFGLPLTNSQDQQVLWVTGGKVAFAPEKCDARISTEFIGVHNDSSMFGPDLPYAEGLYDHCIIGIDDGSALQLLTGGVDVENTFFDDSVEPYSYALRIHYATWWYDIAKNTWIPGPYLYIARFGHSCGLLKDSIDVGKTIAIVTGGSADFSKIGFGYKQYPIRETELLIVQDSLENIGQWFGGPKLPLPISHAFQITTSDKKQFIIGEGTVKDDLDLPRYPSARLYRMQCFALKCEWSRMKQMLELRSGLKAVAILLPQNYLHLVNCQSTNP